MRRLKICSVVLLPALKPAFSSAMIFSACGFNLLKGLACSFVGNHEKVQHQHKPYPSHKKKPKKYLYNKATSAVLFNGSIGDWFQTTVGVRQGCLPSPTLFNIFLERIITDTLEDHEGTVSIGGRTITNLCFADDIDGLAGEEEELANLVERLTKPPQPMTWKSVLRRLS